MIFEEVKLYNFGIYQGNHTISLDSPDYKKPVILIGALNGAGKTTFLDALQLVLYGKFAKCSNRGRLGYLTFLEKSINSFSNDKAASITLRFRHGDNKNNPQIYEIKRSWKKDPSKECKEEIFVTFNGVHDQLLSEQWDDFVNEFMPQSISELFFFDGEKIEDLADPKRSAELLKTGIEALLGLEMLSKLSSDLKVLKRKKQEGQLNENDIKELDILKDEIDKFINTDEELKKELLNLDEQEKVAEENVNSIQEKLLSNGADKLGLKNAYNDEKAELLQKSFEVKHELQKLVAGSLPLAIIPSLIEDTLEQVLIEKEANIFKNSYILLEKQKDNFLRLLGNQFENKDLVNSIKLKLDEESISNSKKYEIECYLESDPTFFIGLNERIQEEMETAQKLVYLKSELDEQILLIERKIHTIPSLESVKDLIEKSAILQSNLQNIKDAKSAIILQIEDNITRIKNLESEYNSILLRTTAFNFEQKRQNQIIKHIDILNNIVSEFNEQLVKENISKLERSIKSKFDLLKRKDSLINKVKINAADFSITLLRENMDIISPERLSAGERQLFAIAILWGLADSSGKELPTIIDTPMGRLDGEHRTRLIEQYFPLAASQVILLSTDEEIYGQYYKKLKPFIAQEYNISYDEKNNSSYIKSGYLEVAI